MSRLALECALLLRLWPRLPAKARAWALPWGSIHP